MVAPFKKPLSFLPENVVFNNHVSMLHIGSKHAIGFLKGWFHSLKGLRVNIRDEQTHKYATYWVAGCAALHAYALWHEQEECAAADDNDPDFMDPFVDEGLSSEEESDDLPQQPVEGTHTLAAGKAWREELTRALFHAKEKWAGRCGHAHYRLLGQDPDSV